MKRNTLRAAAAALALALPLVTAGCNTGINTAAIVNGQRITEQEVGVVVTQVNEAFHPQTPFTADKALTALIWAPEVLAFADENGFPQSESSARAMMPGITDPDPATIRVVQTSNAMGHLGPEHEVELSQRLQGLHVSVNPKFGAFDPSKAAILPSQPNWLTNVAG